MSLFHRDTAVSSDSVLGSRPLRLNGVRWWLAENAAPVDTAPLIREALRQMESGQARNQKRGRRKALYPVALLGSEVDHLLKVNRYRPGAALRRRVRGSKARHELETAESLARRGIPTPLPLAAGEEIVQGLLVRCLLLIPLVPKAMDLREWWGRSVPSPRERRDLTRALARLVRASHDVGLDQDDLAPNNVLVASGGPDRLLMIDFERARLAKPLTDGRRHATLAKLERHMAPLRSAEGFRFLLEYAGSDPKRARQLLAEVQGAARALARRDTAHLRSTTTRDGRRFQRIRIEGWKGAARRGVARSSLEQFVSFEIDGIHRSVRTPPGWLVPSADLSPRKARHLWVMAHLLHVRGLAPPPLAWVTRERSARLLFEASTEGKLFEELETSDRVSGAVIVLLARLLTLGQLHEPPRRDQLELAPNKSGVLEARLLAPGLLSLSGPPGISGDALLRSRARKIFDRISAA